MRSFLLLLVLLVPLPCMAQQPSWYLMSREEGCLDLKTLVEMEKLPRTPISPEDYAQMMRERGKEVSLELPKDVPADLKGKIVQVRIANEDGGLVFVRDEVCRTLRK
jgi:hypothetical protein